MKTIQDEPATKIRPEPASRAGLAWTWNLKRLLKYTLSTEIGLVSVIAVLTVLVFTLILSSRYLVTQEVIQANTSLRDVLAQQTLRVEDPVETRRIRYEARQNVAPIYKTQAGVDRLVLDRLVDLLEDIQAIRQNPGLSKADKVSQLMQEPTLHHTLSEELANTLVTTPHWNRLYEAAMGATQAIMAKGLTSEDFRMKREILIRSTLDPKLNLSSNEEEAVVSLVSSRLRPTLIIDEESTEKARDIAVSNIKPVIEVYAKGDVIVKKGQELSEVQRAALQKQGSITSQNRWLMACGVALLTLSLMGVVWGYLYRFEHSNFFKPAYAGLLAITSIITVAGLAVWMQFRSNYPIEYFPIAILSLVVCIFTHPRIAIMVTMMVLLLCGLTLRIPLEPLSVLVISSLCGVFVLARKPVPKDRNDLILAGVGVGVAKVLVLVALSFMNDPLVSEAPIQLITRLGWGFLSGLITGIVTLGVLPILESWFKLVTPYTLLELGNHDRPMLRRMQMEAPGTFHHSLMVASLAEAAAEAIGANPILARVGALYHDIGKVKRPLFFVENQAYFGVENPHDKLTPRLSKMVITAHPRDGIEMGKQLGLPKAILRFMPEHHGTLMAGYFYNKAVLEEGEENVNKAQFRYPGPKPQSKETAIVMMADAAESSVRALKSPTVQQVEERVDKIIKQRIDDGQFNECPITFQEIQMVRDTFVRILRGIQHNRIEYQQNVLQELGNRQILDALKPAGQTASLPPTPDKIGNGTSPPPAEDAESLIELDSLLALQEAEKPQGPDCC